MGETFLVPASQSKVFPTALSLPLFMSASLTCCTYPDASHDLSWSGILVLWGLLNIARRRLQATEAENKL